MIKKKEFLLSSFLHNRGITHEVFCVHITQQKDHVNVNIKTFLMLLVQLNFRHIYFYPSGVRVLKKDVYMINITPSPLLKDKTPHELLFSKPLILSHLKVIGCLCDPQSTRSHRPPQYLKII